MKRDGKRVSYCPLRIRKLFNEKLSEMENFRMNKIKDKALLLYVALMIYAIWFPIGSAYGNELPVEVHRLDKNNVIHLKSILDKNSSHVQEIHQYFVLTDGPPKLIPFYSRNFANYLATSKGADCRTQDVIQDASTGQLRVMHLYRAVKQGYTDREKVTLDIYQFVTNPDGIPGFPDAYFELKESRQSKREYCDVADAAAKEWALKKSNFGDK